MALELLRSLVWMDYRLAVLFTVIMPLILLLWAVIQNAQPIVHLMVIYWRVASLLMISLYLMVAQMPVSFLTSWGALILIPLSLWFWIDLNEEVADRQGALKLAFTSWRWGITLYAIAAVLGQLPFLNCAFSAGALDTRTCQIWLEPAMLYQQILHPNAKIGTLGFLASGALIIYVLSFGYFILFRLTKQGRSATGL
uniref:DUF3177 domain-containing protein n=1 Tax=Cyanothece sp. (strain PCC 7425 / ATCC 29141) TaxID=395961 RepID=B8HUM3_CYAP4